jgi:DNA polymerase bacteriophage-type
MTVLSWDLESASEIDLKVRGLDVYTTDPSTRMLMGAYAFDNSRIQHYEGPRPPAELREALLDPHVEKHAFNAQFERVFARRVLKIKTPYEGWRCTMVRAYMHSFVGTLDQVGKAIGLPQDKQKLATGKKLINLFCKPQRITKKQPILWRDGFTDPAEWEEFCEYNVQDVEAERSIWNRLAKYPILETEWQLYEIDQIINDRGIPIDMTFVENAIRMVAFRKAELKEQMQDLTGLANPLSGPQLLPWLQERGYPFADLQKTTVKKVLLEHEEGEYVIEEDAVEALKLRGQAVRTSTAKYNALKRSIGPGDRFRFGAQFCGASRTGRDAGRRFQPTNLVRTPAEIEETGDLDYVTDVIRNNDYDGLRIYVKEPMDALAGTARSAIRAPEGYVLRVCDLAAIETCVGAFLCGCERMLNVVRNGLDPYKDFGTELYGVPYEEITKKQRTNSKPAVLGACYRLGGGDLKAGKRTGLWGYAESMGIRLSREESHRSVKVFRDRYPEYPKVWYALEDAAMRCLRSGAKTRPVIRSEGQSFHVPVTFELRRPFLIMWLPTGRPIYYHQPRVQKREMHWPDGGMTVKEGVTYMGQPQGTRQWVRMDTHGGKFFEQATQGTARDVLYGGVKAAHEDGFNLVLRVHDELAAVELIGSNSKTSDRLREMMIQSIVGLENLPLNSSADDVPYYRK